MIKIILCFFHFVIIFIKFNKKKNQAFRLILITTIFISNLNKGLVYAILPAIDPDRSHDHQAFYQ